MAKGPENKSNSEVQNNPNAGAKVIPIGSSTCVAEGCKSKSARANYCAEHFVWFKEGLINREGQRVPDFDKKFQAFSRRKAA